MIPVALVVHVASRKSGKPGKMSGSNISDDSNGFELQPLLKGENSCTAFHKQSHTPDSGGGSHNKT